MFLNKLIVRRQPIFSHKTEAIDRHVFMNRITEDEFAILYQETTLRYKGYNLDLWYKWYNSDIYYLYIHIQHKIYTILPYPRLTISGLLLRVPSFPFHILEPSKAWYDLTSVSPDCMLYEYTPHDLQ